MCCVESTTFLRECCCSAIASIATHEGWKLYPCFMRHMWYRVQVQKIEIESECLALPYYPSRDALTYPHMLKRS